LNGVNIELFTKEHDDNATRKQFGINGDHVVAFVGSFEPWHGVGLLVSGFQHVLNRIPNSQLLLVGDGYEMNKTVLKTSELGLNEHVKFLGRLTQDQIASILSASKVVVAPYPFEYGDIVGSPLKLVEYMASGRGIVASTAPIHEIIEHGVTGLRVAPANSAALADGIIQLIENDSLRNEMGRCAAVRARQYSWANVANRLSVIFLEQIKRNSKRGIDPAS